MREFMNDNWELLYTDSKKDDLLVNQVCINVQEKLYILQLDVDSCVTDDADESGDPIGISYYISEQLFDFIVESLKKQGFKQTEWEFID